MKNISEGNAVFWAVEKDGDLIGELYAFFDIEEDRDFADGEGTAYLCAFRAGWEMSTAHLVMSALLEFALIAMGVLLFQEALTWNKLVGVAVCLAGLFLINMK